MKTVCWYAGKLEPRSLTLVLPHEICADLYTYNRDLWEMMFFNYGANVDFWEMEEESKE